MQEGEEGGLLPGDQGVGTGELEEPGLLAAVENRAEFTLSECAFSNGFVMTGEGKYQFNKDRFVLRVHVTGEQNCFLIYKRVGADASVTGRCDGVQVDERKILSDEERFEPKAREGTRKLR